MLDNSQSNEVIEILVGGSPLPDLPKNLYIPPDALQILLATFEGPLDLLLYLIKNQDIDILDIPISEITHQYMQYIDLMREMKVELAAEYLLMAAMLAEIKSRLLLPRSAELNAEEDDPRAELVRRLQEYEQFKQAAEKLDALPRLERDHFLTAVDVPDMKADKPLPEVSMEDLMTALRLVLERCEMNAAHVIRREPLSVRERMSSILIRLSGEDFMRFTTLFSPQEGRAGVVTTFIAILELLREPLIEMVQSEPYAPLHVRAL